MEQVLGDSLLDLFVCFFSCISTQHLQFWPQSPEFPCAAVSEKSSTRSLTESPRLCGAGSALRTHQHKPEVLPFSSQREHFTLSYVCC